MFFFSLSLSLKAVRDHTSQLVRVLDGHIDPSVRVDHLNTLKMTCYLICQFVEIYECEVTKPTTSVGGRVRTSISFSFDCDCIVFSVFVFYIITLKI